MICFLLNYDLTYRFGLFVYYITTKEKKYTIFTAEIVNFCCDVVYDTVMA